MFVHISKITNFSSFGFCSFDIIYLCGFCHNTLKSIVKEGIATIRPAEVPDMGALRMTWRGDEVRTGLFQTEVFQLDQDDGRLVWWNKGDGLGFMRRGMEQAVRR